MNFANQLPFVNILPSKTFTKSFTAECSRHFMKFSPFKKLDYANL